jgi:DNA repair exonuclease SbcCD ATPase subunit
MKKIFTISIVVALAMICSCQKQDSAAEQQLAERTRQLEARETALDGQEKALQERESALAERESALAEREKAIANASTIASEVQRQTSDPAQVKADRDRRIEQLPAEVRALIPDPEQVNSVKFEKQTEATQTGLQDRSSDAAQLKAEQQKRIEQLPPEVRALIPDPARMNSIKFETKDEAAGSASRFPAPTPQ